MRLVFHVFIIGIINEIGVSIWGGMDQRALEALELTVCNKLSKIVWCEGGACH
jgi:hypothetical protein